MTRSRLLAIILGSAFLVGGAAAPAQAVVAPSPSMVQTSDTEAHVTFPAVSGATKYRVSVTDSTGNVIYEKTGKSLDRTVAIPSTASTKYTYWARSIDSKGSATSSTRTFTSRKATTNIRVATYNVCAGPCDTSSANHTLNRKWAERNKVVNSRIIAAGVDAFAVQETNGFTVPSGYVKLSGTAGRYIYYRSSTLSPNAWNGSALPRGVITVKSTRASTAKEQNFPYAILRNKKTNSRVFIVGIHLTSTDTKKAEKDRVSEITQTVAKVNTLKGSLTDIPQIYLGDFNGLNHSGHPADVCDTYSDCFRDGAHNFLTGAGFTDSELAAEATTNYALSSYNQHIGDVRDFRPEGWAPFHFDHVYAKTGTRILDWSMTEPAASFKDNVSDHNMVTVNLAADSY